MNAPLLDEKISRYKQKIQKLDTLAAKLPASKKRAFKADRRRFEQRLEAWQQTLGSDLAIFDSNVEEGYCELEAHLTTNIK